MGRDRQWGFGGLGRCLSQAFLRRRGEHVSWLSQDQPELARCEGVLSRLLHPTKAKSVSRLSKVETQEQLHQLENHICEEVKTTLTNIKSQQLQSYNKVRKPVDLYIVHLVALAHELDGYRKLLTPLLFLPLDSQILRHEGLFAGGELQKRWHLPSKPDFQDVRSEATYMALQQQLQLKADAVATARGKAFYRIYFDLLWGNRYANWGGNLFETNPKSANSEESCT